MIVKSNFSRKCAVFITVSVIYLLFFAYVISILAYHEAWSSLSSYFFIIFSALLCKGGQERITKLYLFLSSVVIGICECTEYRILTGEFLNSIVYLWSISIIFLLVPLYLLKQRSFDDVYSLIWISSPCIALYLVAENIYYKEMLILNQQNSSKLNLAMTLFFLLLIFLLYKKSAFILGLAQEKYIKMYTIIQNISLPKSENDLIPNKIVLSEFGLSFAITLIFIILASILLI